MNILVLDDDPMALSLLEHQLTQLGCASITLCGHAELAMPLVSTDIGRYELVFCDLQMPEIDGVEFIRHLGRVGYVGGLVLLSAEDPRVLQTVDKLARAHGIPVLAAVQKPAPLGLLQQLLTRHAARREEPRKAARPRYSADELDWALQRDELVVHVQPKVRLTDGALVGAEALVRWQHPVQGLVFPDQFIAAAEGHHLIDELTRRVLEHALRHLRCWHDEGLDIGVSVNVSMDNLVALDFPDLVLDQLVTAGVPVSCLTLEVTESRLMTDAVKALDILTRLRLKRIKLSIDDFGTGYSSLAQLRDVPFEELKLDRSFVHGAVGQPALSAIVGNTLAMARELGLASVAEGVETRADWDHVQALGCEVAQGYFVARPMPAADLAAWRVVWEQRCLDEGLRAAAAGGPPAAARR
jgi:EAL domain-containing protein (putative c-di-GMP-specific phosphodiesterase class I)/CheY-like chemotaxis protein